MAAILRRCLVRFNQSKISDIVSGATSTAKSGSTREPSARVLKLADDILNLTLIEAADLCEVCHSRLAPKEGSSMPGYMPMYGAMFGGSPLGGMQPMQAAQAVSPAGSQQSGTESAASANPSSGKPIGTTPQDSAPVKHQGKPPGAPAAAAEASKQLVSVKLISVPADKRVVTIKEVKGITGLGLKESKELVDGVPAVIKKSITPDEAKAIKAKLEAAGAQCELE